MNQITILDQANQPMGPFTRAQVTEKLQRGEITLGSLAFVEGLTQWTPLREVLAHIDASQPPASGALPTPPSPYAPTPSAAYSYAATMQPPEHLVYAGFWLRVAAIFIDGIIFLPLSLISYALSSAMKHADDASARLMLALLSLGFSLFLIVARWLYFALLESSRWQATVGKKAMGIKVTGMDGGRIGFGRATGRYFAKFISALILLIGFMMAGWTERKQALHDMIAGTLVVRD